MDLARSELLLLASYKAGPYEEVGGLRSLELRGDQLVVVFRDDSDDHGQLTLGEAIFGGSPVDLVFSVGFESRESRAMTQSMSPTVDLSDVTQSWDGFWNVVFDLEEV